ncbi:thrombospondin type 1 domain-containing protein [Phthorimaea operculella]|nr:thrombospondin type 1 domain-containing protein [Phthorimaea operculella]
MCVPFNYGGCRGTRNNFISQEDCLNTCSLIINAGAPGSFVPAAGQLTPALSSNYPGLSVTSIVPISNSLPANGPAQLPNSNDCQLGPWSKWSPCSVTCGTGFQERTRVILNPGGLGGKPCTNQRLTRRRRCSRLC